MEEFLVDLAPYALLLFVPGIAAYSCTLVIRQLWKRSMRKDPDGHEPELWAISLRLISTFVGTLAGLGLSLLGGWDVAYGLGLGFIGGAMNAFIVFVFKQWMKKRAGVTSTGNTRPPGD